MELTYECPACGSVCRARAVETSSTVACPVCAKSRDSSADAFEPNGLVACPLCATGELYVQKDFPQGLGLALVIFGFVVSTYFWYHDRPVPALAVLLVSALADMALYYIVPNVTICYRCLSQIRGKGSNPGGRFASFDLAIGERYRQERLRVEEHRGRSL